MMKLSLLFITACSVIMLLSGCGDSEIEKLRSEYIAGCKNSGAPKDICSCTFDKTEEKYTESQLLQMNKGVMPEGFMDFQLKAMLSCSE
jgi:hypothetical protein